MAKMVNNASKNIVSAIGLITSLIILILVSALLVGSLTSTSVIPNVARSGSVTNETGAFANITGYTVAEATRDNFVSTLTDAYNYSDGTYVGLGNLSLSNAGVLTNATDTVYENLSISYSYTYTDQLTVGGLNISSLGTSFGSFITALIGFFAVMGVILAIVWMVMYLRPLFDKDKGIQSFAGS